MATTKSMPPSSTTNELSHLIPGYTAPMRLDGGLSAKSLSELRKRTARRDAAMYARPSGSGSWGSLTRDIASQSMTSFGSAAMDGKRPSSIIRTTFSSSSTHQSSTTRKRSGGADNNPSTSGSGWFNMIPSPMSSQLKTDLAIIRNRNYLDPKKFYKTADSFDGKVLQLGTVIEGSNEYYTSRLTKKERRMNLTDEVMADRTVTEYAKRKYRELQAEKDVGKGSSRLKGSGGGNKRGRKGGGRR